MSQVSEALRKGDPNRPCSTSNRSLILILILKPSNAFSEALTKEKAPLESARFGATEGPFPIIDIHLYGTETYLMKVEVEREQDGRWIAEVPVISGAMAYGATREEAVSKVEALVLRILADRLISA